MDAPQFQQRKAVFTGSFDPFTLGHLDIVQRAIPLFDEITVLVAINPHKKGWLTLEQRVESIQKSLQHFSNVRVDSWEGLSTQYMRQNGIRYLLRGLRNAQDLEWEQSIAWANTKLDPTIETVFLLSPPALRHVSSSLVREFVRHQADCVSLVPSEIIPYLSNPS